MFCEGSLKVPIMSKISPRIIGVLLSEMGVLFRVTLNSLLQGGIKVIDDLLVATYSLFVSNQLSSVFGYVCMFVVAISYSESCENIVKFPAYEAMRGFGSIRRRISCMQRLKSVGERMEL